MEEVGQPKYFGDYSFNTGTIKAFSVIDYFIFGAILVISASIGLYYAVQDKKRKDITLNDYLLAGRNMSSFPVGLSLLASFMSAITLLGTPGEMYNYTTIYFWIGVSYFFVLAAAAHLYMPVFYGLGVTSAYEYLEKRFGRGVRTAASCTFVFQMVLYMSIVLYAPSLALHEVTGFTLWGSVVSVGVVCTIYTAFGGMKAVLFTDCFQVMMMILSLLAILVKGHLEVGGLDKALESAERTGRLEYVNFNSDPTVRHTTWTLVIGGYFTWVAIFGVNQAQVQRAVTCRTLSTAKKALWYNFPGLCIILYLCCFIGLYLSAFYENCDPIKAKFVENSNQLLPVFVMDVLGDYKGMPGLFVAGLFSGALSTISSGLNSISAVVLEDVIREYFDPGMREPRARAISQSLALFFGAICLAMTWVAAQMGSILQAALSLFGMVAGPLLGVFTLGMFIPHANYWGGLTGLIGSLATMFWIGIGAALNPVVHQKALRFTDSCNISAFHPKNRYAVLEATQTLMPSEIKEEPFYLFRVSYLWYSLIAVITCIAIGLVVSFATGAQDPTELDSRLICPVCDHVFPFFLLPERIRKPLRFGIEHAGKFEPKTSLYTLPIEAEEGEVEPEEGRGKISFIRRVDSEGILW